MDLLTEQAALLALLQDRRGGWNLVADAVEAAGSALGVLEGEAGSEQGTLFDAPGALSLDQRLERARGAIRDWESEGFGLVTLLDPAYPAQLLTVHQRPPSSSTEDASPRTMLVGSRSSAHERPRTEVSVRRPIYQAASCAEAYR